MFVTNATNQSMDTNHKSSLCDQQDSVPIPRISAEKYAGLGDVVAAIAQPIARTIDAVAGTNVAGCGGCAQRQEALNKAVPFNR